MQLFTSDMYANNPNLHGYTRLCCIIYSYLHLVFSFIFSGTNTYNNISSVSSISLRTVNNRMNPSHTPLAMSMGVEYVLSSVSGSPGLAATARANVSRISWNR